MEHFENSNNKRILILEQDGIIAMDIQRELENNGYRAYRTLSLVNNSITHLAIVDTLYKKNELEELKKQSPEWWFLLREDEDLYIEIRKDNYINAYYLGGAVAKIYYENGFNYRRVSAGIQ